MAEYAVKLVFYTTSGKTYTLTVPYSHEDVTAEEIASAMDEIIASDVVLSSAGTLVSKASVSLETTNKTLVSA